MANSNIIQAKKYFRLDTKMGLNLLRIFLGGSQPWDFFLFLLGCRVEALRPEGSSTTGITLLRHRKYFSEYP